MKSQNIIIFSSIDWTTHWQIHHQLAMSLIKNGNKVLFVENIGVRSPGFKDISRIWDRIKSRIKSTYGFSEVEKNIIIYSPLFVPFPYNRVSTYLNTLFITDTITSWTERTNFVNPIVISFLPTPSIQGVIKKISPFQTVYYCADDMGRTLNNPIKLIQSEKEMFAMSDVTLTTSHKKYREASLFSDSVHFTPAGVDIKKFVYSPSSKSLPEDIKSLDTKIIGYVGAISEVFDKDLVVNLANHLPDSTIVLVGPLFTDISVFSECKNILLVGQVEHSNVASYMQAFDVALIPYIVSDSTDSVYPCKLNEYLAMGLPVVTSNLEEIRLFLNEFKDSVFIGKSHNDFILGVERIINNNSKSNEECQRRVNIAKENVWESRFAIINKALEDSLLKMSTKKVDWKSHLSSFYKKRRLSRLKKLVIIFSFYLLLFHSPLFWYMGDKLVVRDDPKVSDAIVVFSGNGEVSYQNTSYQRRALDAIRLFQEGYAKKIYISSGIDQTISEVKFIELFLISKGIPISSINILDQYPHSTLENVLMVNKMLDDDVDSIIFITSPYHSLRAKLTWQKNSGLEIISPPVVDTPSKVIKWGVGIDKMRIILYEYAAIVHNWINNRL
jgi:uncharacterized SAM-binding protein YcdF (DUF218 family)/glycosyltransferase involved in cell wall biosynthesis